MSFLRLLELLLLLLLLCVWAATAAALVVFVRSRSARVLRCVCLAVKSTTERASHVPLRVKRCAALLLPCCCLLLRCDAMRPTQRPSDRATQRPNRRTKERASDTARQTDKRFNTRPPSLPLPTSPYRPTALLLSCSWCVCRLYEWVTAWRSCQLTAAWWVCCVCVSLLLLLLLRPLRVSHVARRAAVHNGLM